MSDPLSEQQLAEIRVLLDGAPAAKDELIKSIAEAYRDRREHDHPKHAEDWFCTNLAGWMGDRMPVVLSRLLDAEAEVARLKTAEATYWLATYEESVPEVLGRYTTRQAAMDHIHAVIASEEHTTSRAIEERAIWRPGGTGGEQFDCWLSDADGDDDKDTGYSVGPVVVRAAYVPPQADTLPEPVAGESS